MPVLGSSTVELGPRPNTQTPQEAGIQTIEVTSEQLQTWSDEQLIHFAEYELGLPVKPSYTRDRLLSEITKWAASARDAGS